MKASQKKPKSAQSTNSEQRHEAILDPLMRTLGTLKLPEEDCQKFHQALAAYGFEKSAAFLRRCAYALVKHHQANDELAQPLSFKVSHSSQSKHGDS